MSKKTLSIHINQNLKELFSELKWYDYVLFFAAFFVMFFCFDFPDLLQTTSSSFAILNGHLADFYQYNAVAVPGDDYEIIIYLIFAAWNIPMMLLGKTTSLPHMPSFVMQYNKILPVIFLILCVWMVYRITRKAGLKHKSAFYAALMMATVPYAFLTTIGMGMYDSLYVFFLLFGLYYLLFGTKRSEMIIGLLLFGVSFGIKPLGLFVIIPLLLYRDKNLLKLAGKFLVSLTPYIICKLLYWGQTGAGGSRFIQILFSANYSPGFYTVSLFVVGYIFVCLWAYNKKLEKENPVKSLYIALLAMLPFYMFVSWNPQWLLLFAALSTLLISLNKRKSMFLLFQCIMSIFFIGLIWSYWTQVFGGVNPFGEGAISNGSAALLMRLNTGLPAVSNIIFPEEYKLVYISGIVAVILFVTFKLNPWRYSENYELDAEPTKKDFLYARLRFSIPMAIFILPMMYWLFKAII